MVIGSGVKGNIIVQFCDCAEMDDRVLCATCRIVELPVSAAAQIVLAIRSAIATVEGVRR